MVRSGQRQLCDASLAVDSQMSMTLAAMMCLRIEMAPAICRLADGRAGIGEEHQFFVPHVAGIEAGNEKNIRLAAILEPHPFCRLFQYLGAPLQCGALPGVEIWHERRHHAVLAQHARQG